MKFILLTAQSSSTAWYDTAVAEYKKKINFYYSFEIKRVKTLKINREGSEAKRLADSASLLKGLAPGDYVILLDEKGTSLDSKAFATKIGQCIDKSIKQVVFVIGGPYGVTDELRRRAQQVISLSPLTYNHWVAELVLLEQLYRGITILKGIPYHNA